MQAKGAAAAAATATPALPRVMEECMWSAHGRWDYVVGLVGKPSAGKSTFFNACVDPATEEDGARCASFPFTTIAPNIGRAFFAVPDPALAVGLQPGACR